MAWVIDNSKATGSDYAVLLMLANHYNHQTGQCDPGYRRIAAEARVGRGTVGRAVARLCELGELEVITSGAGKRTTRYHFPWLSTDDVSVPQWDARESLASHEDRLASHGPPRSVPPGRDRSLKQNLLTAHTADSTPDGVGDVAPKPLPATTLGRGRDAPPLWELDDDGNARPINGTQPQSSGPGYRAVRVAATDGGREALAEARRLALEGKSKSKSRHPSNGGPK